ncbi:MAG: Orotate phosphoribosyltransferase, partial [uncultured Gemmatimonadetes bacterium]
ERRPRTAGRAPAGAVFPRGRLRAEQRRAQPLLHRLPHHHHARRGAGRGGPPGPRRPARRGAGAGRGGRPHPGRGPRRLLHRPRLLDRGRPRARLYRAQGAQGARHGEARGRVLPGRRPRGGGGGRDHHGGQRPQGHRGGGGGGRTGAGRPLPGGPRGGRPRSDRSARLPGPRAGRRRRAPGVFEV